VRGSSGSTSSGGGEAPGVRPVYGEMGPGLEARTAPLDAIAEVGAGEAAERYLINHHLAAKSVQLQLRLVRGSGW
jgi:hypothetical protein